MGDCIEKKPDKKDECECTVYVNVYCCANKKKEPPKAYVAEYDEKDYDCEKPKPAPKDYEGCKVIVNVFCEEEKKK